MPTSSSGSEVLHEPSPQAFAAIPKVAHAETPSSEASTSINSPVEKTIKELAPTVESVRDEVAGDPHVTPKAILDFSIALGQKMEQAEVSEDAARKFFSELEECVLTEGQTTAHSVQALCLLNAKRLAKKYSTLQTNLERLEVKAHPEAVRLTKGMQ